MPKLPLTQDRLTLMRRLGTASMRLYDAHRRELEAIGWRIPVGGAHMDGFFRLEGINGVLRALREGASRETALQEGLRASTNAVRLWNDSRKRDYQVHRWEETAHDYIRHTVKRASHGEV